MVPIAPINIVNPAIAATPINANGAIGANITKIPAIRDINDPSNIALLIAFLTLLIIAKTPTNANIGNAIAVKAKTPSKAALAKAPIIVSGISANVSTPTNIAKALTLVVAFSTPLIRARTPTKANIGRAIAVNNKTPFKALLALFPIKLTIAKTPVMTSIRPPRIIADLIADAESIFDIK